MENNLVQQFTNSIFGNVRSIIINGEPWFVGIDVASCLGYAKPRNAINEHVDFEDKMDARPELGLPSIPYVDSMGRTQTIYPTFINESGLYSLIFSSKLPAAKEFKHWVTSEVLPTMRKIGFDKAMESMTAQLNNLRKENFELNKAYEGLQNSFANQSLDYSYNTDAKVRMIENIQNCPLLTPEQKAQLIVY